MKKALEKPEIAVDQPKKKNRALPSVRSKDLLPQQETTHAGIESKWAKHYQHLLGLRARLLEDKAELVEDAMEQKPAYSMSMADAATDEFDRDLALGQLAAKQDALYEIDEAIRRLEHNLYGICEITGKPIPLSRLAAVPWTRFTEEAEEELERQGAVSHPRLGPVASTKARSPAAFAPAPEDTETEEPKMEDLRMLEHQSTEEPELTATNEEPDL